MNREILTKLADVLISSPTTPFTFDCEIKFKDNGKTERVTMCYCTEEEYDKLAGDNTFDEVIFFYLISTDTVLRDTMNNEDWEIIDIYEDSVIRLARCN